MQMKPHMLWSGIKEAVCNHDKHEVMTPLCVYVCTHTCNRMNERYCSNLTSTKGRDCRARWSVGSEQKAEQFQKHNSWTHKISRNNFTLIFHKSTVKIKMPLTLCLSRSHLPKLLPQSALKCSLWSEAGGFCTDSCASVCIKWQFRPEDFGWLRLTSCIGALSPRRSATACRWTVCSPIWSQGKINTEKGDAAWQSNYGTTDREVSLIFCSPHLYSHSSTNIQLHQSSTDLCVTFRPRYFSKGLFR